MKVYNILFQGLDYGGVLREGVHEIVKYKYQHNNTPTTLYWDNIQQRVNNLT